MDNAYSIEFIKHGDVEALRYYQKLKPVDLMPQNNLIIRLNRHIFKGVLRPCNGCMHLTNTITFI